MRCLTTLAPLLPLPGGSSRSSKSKSSSNNSSAAAASSDPCYCLQQWVQARAAAASGSSSSSSADAVKSAAVADMVRVFEKSYCPVPVAALSPTTTAASTASSSSSSSSSSAAGRTAAVQSWLDHLSTATDCYLFALDTGILTAVDIALPASSASSSSSSGQAKRPAADSTSSDTSTAAAVGTSPHILNSFGAFVRHYSSTLHSSSSQTSSSSADDDDGAASLWAQLTTAGASVDAALSQEEPLLPQQADAIKLLRAQVLRRGFTLLDKLLAQLTASEQATALCNGSSGSSSARSTAVWSSPLHELLLLSLTCPWHRGLLPRPSEADEVQSLLPAAAERLLRHWKSLDDAAAASMSVSTSSGSDSALLLHSTQRLLHVVTYSDTGLTEHYDLCDWTVRRYALASTASVSAEAAEQMTPQERSAARDTEVCAHVLRSYSALHRAGLLAAGASQLQPAALAKALMRTLAALPLAQLKPEAHTVLCGALRFAVALGLPMVARTPADEPSMLR
jgi:hypothetical protein